MDFLCSVEWNCVRPGNDLIGSEKLGSITDHRAIAGFCLMAHLGVLVNYGLGLKAVLPGYFQAVFFLTGFNVF